MRERMRMRMVMVGLGCPSRVEKVLDELAQILLCIPGQQLRLQLRRWPMPARLKTKCGLPGNVVFGPHTLGYSFTIC